jgi:hypothetical protein
MFACENRGHIVLIRSGLLSIFVIAGATGLAISPVARRPAAGLEKITRPKAVQRLSTFALA